MRHRRSLIVSLFLVLMLTISVFGQALAAPKAELNQNATIVAAATPGPTSFVDVPPSDPDYVAIMFMSKYGLMTGYADGIHFGPDDMLLRVQITKPLTNFVGVTADQANCFPNEKAQIDQVLWNDLCFMNRIGVMRGYGDGTVGPLDELQLGQVIALLMRVQYRYGFAARTAVSNNELVYPNVPVNSDFRTEISGYVRYCGGYVPGYPDTNGNLDWTSTVTRRQAVKVFYGCLSILGK